MILVDTSVWVDHFRRGDARLSEHLAASQISIHPFVIAELALGSLADRRKTLFYMEQLPQVKVAHTHEVRHMIERDALFGKGIGFVDAHLIVSTLLTPHTMLWTHDRRLRDVAGRMGLGLALP